MIQNSNYTHSNAPYFKQVSRIPGNLVIMDCPIGNLSEIKFEEILESDSYIGGMVIISGSLTFLCSHISKRISEPSIMLFNGAIRFGLLQTSADFKGFLVLMSERFVNSLAVDFSRTELRARISYEPLTHKMMASDVKSYSHYVALLTRNISRGNEKTSKEVSRLLVKALFYEVIGEFPIEYDDMAHGRKDILARDFIRLVHKYGSYRRDLEFYAKELCITPKYLSALVSKNTSKKSNKWIEDETMRMARYLLKSTTIPVGQISDKLNFGTPADFTRYFRCREGITPLKYRNQ